jgi:glutamine synthetase
MKTVLEYVWLDANEHLRSKTKVADGDINKLELVPIWGYDGSSTDQAPGNHSDVTLTPVKLLS